MRKLYIETYGCQMNLADTELVLGLLRPHGYEQTHDPAQADVILLNTCAIRDHAEERVLGRLGQLFRHKAHRPEVTFGLCGCMAQHHRGRLLEKAPFLDFIVGPDSYRHLPEVLGREKTDPLVDVRLDRDETYADIAPLHSEGVRAWVTVMRGCDRFCTFCIVPYVRGRERSLPAQVILDRVRFLSAEGFKEVVYLGQTVNAYDDGECDFAELLRRTNEIDGIERIRFTSPHPSDMFDHLIEVMATCERVSPYIHLPLQSGSNRVLKKMARDYTVEQYVELVGKLREAIPDVALSTDIIVGFPGEDEEDLLATYELMAEIRYDSAFMFKYSRREGTRAYTWGETVSQEEKGRRLQSIIALQTAISAEINQRLIGQSVEVLVEGPARRQEGWLCGKTPQFKTTVFPAHGTRPGEILSVRVTGATSHTLTGTEASQIVSQRAAHGWERGSVTLSACSDTQAGRKPSATP